MRPPTRRDLLGDWSAARWAWCVLAMVALMCLTAAYIKWAMPHG